LRRAFTWASLLEELDQLVVNGERHLSGSLRLRARRPFGRKPPAVRAMSEIERVCADNELVITTWSPIHLQVEAKLFSGPGAVPWNQARISTAATVARARIITRASRL